MTNIKLSKEENLVNGLNPKKEKVAIVIVTFNALRYCIKLFCSIHKTDAVDYEIVVVDNNSSIRLKIYLIYLFLTRRIKRLCLLDKNTLFARGNNIGVKVASKDCTHILLLNSDVLIKDSLWLRKMLDHHKRGITGLGLAPKSTQAAMRDRAEGYCFLIDRDIYHENELDETYAFWWSLSKVQGEIMKKGYSVQAVEQHERILHHFGQKSGSAYKKTHKPIMRIDDSLWDEWFASHKIQIIEKI